MSRSRFTPETRAALLASLRDGSTLTEACHDAFIAENTVKTWLKRGRREDDTEFSAFAVAVDEAREAAAASVMDDAEFRAHLNRAVRKGSVVAMKLWWQVNHPPDAPSRRSELDDLDRDNFVAQLARRRTNGGGGHD